MTKLERVYENIEKSGFDRLLVCAPLSIGYLIGKFIGPGERMLALILEKGKKPLLIANKLFLVGKIDGVDIVEYADTDDSAKVLADQLKAGKLGVDKEFKARFLLPLMDLRKDIEYRLGSACVDEARMLKTPAELKKMQESSLLNDEALKRTIAEIKPGVSENDVADAYRRHAKELGADSESFDSLICFGANCAEPHHDTSSDIIKEGDSVILDVGLKHEGYCSDMTRTVFFGAPTEEQQKVYDIVLKANAAGRAAVKPGVPLKDIDAAARKVIEDAGYGEYFIHRTGHGIGLEVHEFPDVSAASEAIATPGMVFSIEPGIYLPGRFGVRIEDLVAVTEDGAITLNRLEK